jgi:hypothetical protein
MRIFGVPNFGTAVDGTGTAVSGFADTLAFASPGGRRLMNLSGTVFLLLRRKYTHFGVPSG